MKISLKYSVLLILLLLSCLSCSSSRNHQGETKDEQTNNSLYVKMGEQAALDKVVENLINIIGRDDVIFPHFANSNVSYFRKNLTLFLCDIVDGPCQYSGDTMQDIHRGMHINKNQFNHFVELFIEAMDVSGISYPIQNELLARLAPLRKKIISI